MSQGIPAATGLIERLPSPPNGTDGIQYTFQIALLHDETGIVRDCLDTAACTIGDYRRTAGYRFQIDRRVIVLPGQVDKGIGCGIEFGQLMYVFRARDGNHIRGKPLLLFRFDADQYNSLIVVQHPGQADKIIQPFLPAPNAGHTQQKALTLQAVFLFYTFRIEQIEHICVYAIVDYPEVILPEEGVLHLPSDPLRHGDNRQQMPGHGGEGRLLVGIVPSRSVEQQARRKLPLLRAMAAASLPSVAAGIRVIVAMTRVKPAVMHRPDYGRTTTGQIVEQDPVVQEIPMNVVYMNHVRTNPFNALDQFTSSPVGSQPVSVEKAGHHSMPADAPLVAHRKKPGLARPDAITPTTVGYVAFPAMLHGQLADLLHDAARRGIYPQDRIYLKNLFHLSVKEENSITHRSITDSSE